MQRQFTPRAAAAWEPRIVELCDELVAGFFLEHNDDGDADLARDVATPLPVMVIAELLGIPTADRDRFKQRSEEVVYLIGGAIDSALQSASLSAALELAQYFSAIIDERRKDPNGNDLISLFIRAGGDGDEALTHEEIITHCILFLLGGNETTTNLIGDAFGRCWHIAMPRVESDRTHRSSPRCSRRCSAGTHRCKGCSGRHGARSRSMT